MRDFFEKIVDEYDPQTEEQRFVAEQIATCMYRIRRCQDMEDRIMMQDDPFASGALEKLERYRQSIERSYQRFTRRWAEIRKEIHQEQRAVQQQNKNLFYELMRQERELEREVLSMPATPVELEESA